MTVATEEQHQMAVVEFARLDRKLELLHAIPNGSKRSKSEAGRLKAAGVLAGMPDLCLPAAFYIEMKLPGREGRKRGDLADSQWAVFPKLKAALPIFICYGSDAAIALLRLWRSGNYNEHLGSPGQCWQVVSDRTATTGIRVFPMVFAV